MDNGDLEPEEDDEEEVFIMHSCQNERKNHMVTKSQPQSLKFPISFKPAIEKVFFSNDTKLLLIFLNSNAGERPISNFTQN